MTDIFGCLFFIDSFVENKKKTSRSLEGLFVLILEQMIILDSRVHEEFFARSRPFPYAP